MRRVKRHCTRQKTIRGLYMNALPSSSSQLFFLEERRRQCLQDLATLIQKIYRGWKCRTQFLLLKKSQIVVSAWYRRYAVRPPFFFRRNALKTTYKAKRKNRIVHSVFSIFSPFFSISQQQKKYQRIKSATTLVQSYTRGWQVRTFMCIAQNQV